MFPLVLPYPDEDHTSLIDRLAKLYGVRQGKLVRFNGVLLYRYSPSRQYWFDGLIAYASKFTDDAQEQLELILDHSLITLDIPLGLPWWEKLVLRTLGGGYNINRLEHRFWFVGRYRDPATRKYCPVCQKEQKEEYGESYGNRLWYISLMDICPIHGCALHVDPLRCHRSPSGQFDFKPGPITPRVHAETFARLACEFLEFNDLTIGCSCWSLYIWELLRSNNLSLCCPELMRRIKNHWGDLQNSYRMTGNTLVAGGWTWWKILIIAMAVRPDLSVEEIVDGARKYRRVK